LKKKEGTAIDPESFFRNKVDNMLVTASWVEEVRDDLGITGVSQIWDDRPAWYFWLSRFRGAYQLQLESASDDPYAPAGIFSLKYYPSAQERVFPAFSAEERAVVQSPLFDHTNTPRYEERGRIPESLFNVATVFFSTTADDKQACLCFQALTSMRMVYKSAGVQSFSSVAQTRRFTRGETDRQVPAWELGYALFDRLAGFYTFYSKNTPVRIVLTRSPGFEYVFDGSAGFQCVDTDDIHVYSLNLFFGAGHQNGGAFPGTAVADWLEEDAQETLFDRRYGPHENPGTDRLPLPDTAVNPSWWTLARACYSSSLASTCGCEHGSSCNLVHEGEN
jgi:hypothetical protein